MNSHSPIRSQVEQLITALSPNIPEDFEEAIQQLREIDPPTLVEIFSELLADPAPDTAIAISKAIGYLNLNNAAHLLTNLVRQPGKWFSHSDRKAIRLAAIESIGAIRASQCSEILHELLKNSRDLELQLEAVKALGIIGSSRSVAPLLEAMSKNPPVALSAAGALAQIGTEEAFAGLLATLEHPEEMVLSAVVWALGEMRDERAIEPLITLAQNADDFLKDDIIWALERIGSDSAKKAAEKIKKLIS